MTYYTEIGIEVAWPGIISDIVSLHEEGKSEEQILERIKEYESDYFGKE